MQKRIAAILGSIGLFLLFSSTCLYAETPAGSKIGAFNSQEVIAMSKVGQQIENDLKTKITELNGALKAEEEAFQKMKDDIEKKSENWNEIFRERKKRELEKKASEIAEKRKDADLEVKIFKNERLAPIYEELEEVIPTVSKKLGLTLVLDKSIIGFRASTGIFYADAIDISAEIKKELDSRLNAKK